MATRQDWERKASWIAAYRETYGYDHPGDPVGPEPTLDAPDQRAAWHQALTALGPVSSPGVRAMPDGQLWLLRDTYTAATAWAPPYLGKELRLARLGAFDAALSTLRADAEAAAARKTGDHDRAGRQETLAASYQALRDHYRHQEQVLAQVMADRQEWENATVGSRLMAIAADTELRRHPGQKIEPLRSAEPAPASDIQREHPHPATDRKAFETAPRIRDQAMHRQAFRAKITERPQLMAPGDDPIRSDLGRVFPGRHVSGKAPILQPPRPEIIPSARILQLAAEHDTEPSHEAAD
jgi:hypothetical protein